MCEEYNLTIGELEEIDLVNIMKQNTIPLLIMHGANDYIVQEPHPRKYSEITKGPVEYYIFPNSGHCDAVYGPDKDDYINKTINFLDKYMK